MSDLPIMTRLEYLLLTGLASDVFAKLAPSARARTGCLVEVNPDTKEEKRTQIVDVEGPCRLNITKLADILRKEIVADRYLEARVLHRGVNQTEIKKLRSN